ncbi:hypothetical protein ANCCEY_05754 [Ancylostoma ceylanicum]|uniref:Calponin-homology (CH) domain-containing protein n=1 Tax=Ancylostoma ceylanicum TaxID=53326 RepID=A0A0D6LVG6_9BILA|nr:hypothetical protein ANCCEY_05754 [Ancylostoma ceylanicum]
MHPRENGYTRFHRIQNVQYCLDFLKKKSVSFLIKLVNIRPEDIVEGNGKLTLGLIWTIILNFQVSVIKRRQLEEQLSAQNYNSTTQVCLHFNIPLFIVNEWFVVFPSLKVPIDQEFMLKLVDSFFMSVRFFIIFSWKSEELCLFLITLFTHLHFSAIE